MLTGIDSLNNLTTVDEDDVKEKIRKYFEEMDLDDEEIEKRISFATDLEKGFRNLFILMLAATAIGEDLNSRRDDYIDLVYHDYTDAMIENGYSNDTYYSGYGYVEQYARSRCTEIVDTAILHKADDYYFSTDHSIAIGEDESNSVGNYYREQMAIAQGYTMKTWVTMHDAKVRHSHKLVDGETISIFKPFSVGTGLMMFPMDVSLGINRKEVYNCRCVCEYSGKTKGISKSESLDTNLLAGALAVQTDEIIDKKLNKYESRPEVNEARIDDVFFDEENYNNEYDLDSIVSEMKKTKVGQESFDYLKSHHIVVHMDSLTNGGSGVRGNSYDKNITLFVLNIQNQEMAERTLIHEATHLKYKISMSKHAEAICYAFELMHKNNRDYITANDWQECLEFANNHYKSYTWEREAEKGLYEQFEYIFR